MRFIATIEQAGRTATGIPVPEEVLEGLGGGRKPAVKVVLNQSFEYRTTVGSMGGRPMLSLSAERRTAAGVAGGERVDVELTLDAEPRTIEVPDDFAAALEQDAVAKAAFERLAPSHRRAHVDAITGAKAADTRQRRIDAALAKLRG
ncbi:YdeI/OmpD-associated family protein [Lysobacter korlensis]|uniref:YdeI/OmpD-associated family protein n=1 Tax=Lysobacter korlensis TaxID=553636 RepID=A0ABV6RWQ1_9GAMM